MEAQKLPDPEFRNFLLDSNNSRKYQTPILTEQRVKTNNQLPHKNESYESVKDKKTSYRDTKTQ